VQDNTQGGLVEVLLPKFWEKHGDVLKENWDKVLERLDK
jgi:hypothetical protein